MNLLITFGIIGIWVAAMILWMHTPSGKRWFFGETDDAKL